MRFLRADLAQRRPKAVCRRAPAPRAAHWDRPRIRNGFLHYVALIFDGTIGQRTPWFELRYLLDDHVPSTGAERDRGVREDLIKSLRLVVTALLSRLDLRSLRVGHHAGRHRKHDFIGLTVETIAGWTHLSVPTVSRVLRLLRLAGLVHGPGRDGKNVIDQPCDKLGDGSYDHHPAIRRFSELFFAGLGPDIMRQLHELRAPHRPDPGVCREQTTARRAQQSRAAREARLERPPDG